MGYRSPHLDGAQNNSKKAEAAPQLPTKRKKSSLAPGPPFHASIPERTLASRIGVTFSLGDVFNSCIILR